MSAPACLALSAGRELDALVAEKVMGWRWATFINTSYLIPPAYELPEFGRFDPGEGLVTRGSGWTWGRGGARTDLEWTTLSRRGMELPRYSTDIRAAWEVVERGFAWPGHAGKPMLHLLRECANGAWEAQWCSDFGYGAVVRAETAPLAICRAALMALSPERAE